MWWLAGAIIGAVAGAASTYAKGKKEKAALKQQKEAAWQQYLYGQQYSDERFSIQKNEALEHLGVQRGNLDTQLGMSVDDYNTALLGQAFGIQNARIQMSSALGASLAAEGASGVRGNASDEKIRAYASQSLERDIEVQDRQNDDYLKRMMTGANMTLDAIGREEASWMPGGSRVQEKTAQDAYNRNIAQLGQSNFDWQIGQVNPDPFQNPDMWLNYFTGAMNGASSGMQLGYSFEKFKDAWSGIGKNGLGSTAKAALGGIKII